MNRAFLYALKVHDGQKRKDGKPYIVHPFAVANILTENGAEKDLVCAGLLHDVIEDGGVTAEELQKEFGRKVVRLILFDTEDKTLSWERRKSALLAALKDCGRNCAMLVCADKLANLQDISEALLEKGDQVWKHFKAGREKQAWLYGEYLKALSPLSDLKMYAELKETAETVFL